jgi:hypothetical protein
MTNSFKKKKIKLIPQIHKAKTYMDSGYFYAPYIPMLTVDPIDNYLTKLQSSGRLNRDTTMVILSKRNYIPNNKLMIL